MQKNENRKLDLDVAKGIGIVMVVWAHASGPLSNYITQFHMPFFFFVSGLLYKNAGISSKDYIKKKMKTLLVPFWFWNILCYPIYFVLYYWNDWSITVFIKELLEIVLTLNKVPFLGATWFLPALFWVSIFSHCCLKRLEKWQYRDIFLFFSSCIICLLGFNINFPYKISRICICSLFYTCGYLFNKYIAIYVRGKIKALGGIICGAIFIIIASFNTVGMGANVYEYKLLFLIGAFTGTFAVLRLSDVLANAMNESVITKHFIYLGKNTIHIVIWHFLTYRLTILIQMVVMGIGVNAIVAFPVYDASGVWWILYLISGIYGSLLWKIILKNNPLSMNLKKINVI